MPFGGPTHERLAQVDDESPQTTSSGDVWAHIQHGTCNSSANATGFDRALTYSPPFFVRAHQTTKEDCTPGTLKASQVALVEPVAYLKDLVMQGTTEFHHQIMPTLLPEAEPDFDDTTALDADASGVWLACPLSPYTAVWYHTGVVCIRFRDHSCSSARKTHVCTPADAV